MKLRRILAWIALVHIAVFSVVFIIYLIKPDLFNGLQYLTMYSGGVGFLLYIYIYLQDRQKKNKDENPHKLVRDPKNAENEDDNQKG